MKNERHCIQKADLPDTTGALHRAALVMLTAISMPIAATAQDPDPETFPSFYQEPGLSSNREQVMQSGNERIDPFSGKLQWHFVDISVPGNGGLPLKVQRSYSSRNEDLGDRSPLGVGWTMHFGRLLRKADVSLCDFNQFDVSKNPVLELPDGSRNTMYAALGGASFITTDRWKADCSSGWLEVTSPEGTRYKMDVVGPVIFIDYGNPQLNKSQASWYPSTITDRNGNSMTITYTSGPNNSFGPVSVTTSDGRSLTFTYQAGTLTSVTDGSRTWTYEAEQIAQAPLGYFHLKKAIRPDGTSWSYEYNANGTGAGTGTPGGYSMKKITYPTGGQIDYTYSFVNFAPGTAVPKATSVTNKVAGPHSWLYTYAPASTPLTLCGAALCPVDPTLDANKLDKTTVAAPDGNSYVYQHIGYVSATSGYVYLIGTLLFKWTGNSEFEGNSWAGQQISAQANLRPGGVYTFDSDTKAPVLIQRSINRNGSTYTTQLYDANLPGYGFDAYGNPSKITETGPREDGSTQTRVTNVTHFVDPAKWILHFKKDEITDTIGSIVRGYDPNGNMLSESRYGVASSYTYHSTGDLATKTDARSNSIIYNNYFRGVPRTESHPENVGITRTVSNAGNVLTETDGEGVTTTYDYDGLNRITAITHARGNPVSVVWAANTRTITRGNFREVTSFDPFGRRASVVHSDGSPSTITQTFAHDPMGREVFASYPNSVRGTYRMFSAVDQLTILYHDANSTGGGATSGQGYYYAYNTVELTNERGKVFTYSYRGWGSPQKLELMKVAAPEANASVTMARNGLGQLATAVQDGKTREYRYDSKYFLTSTIEPEVGETTFGRDEVGNMASRRVGISGTTFFDYDGRNRLKTIRYPVGTPTVDRTYFKDDRLATVGNTVVSREFSYDGNKNLKQEKVTVDGTVFTTGYDYDGNDALDLMTYASGKTVTYAPDAYGRPTKAMPYLTQIDHHPSGQTKKLVFANGVQTDVTLNNRNWPSRVTMGKGALFFDTNYGYEGNGNVSAIVDSVDSSYYRQMGYDGVDRVTSVAGPWGNGTLAYDGRGNILGQTYGPNYSIGYTYDTATERLLSTVGAKAYTFSYDPMGNVTGNGVTTFQYNDASQMRCSNCGQATEAVYTYDGLGLRAKTVKSAGATVFVHDGNGRLLGEKGPDGSLKDYIYVGGKQVAVWERRVNQ